MVHLPLLKEARMASPSIRSIRTLLPGITPLGVTGPLDVPIAGITNDSRNVTPNSLFVAIKGIAADGHAFIPDVIKKGATCVVHEGTLPLPAASSTLFIQVRDSRRALGILASNYYGNPSSDLTMIGITGTNGKTTLAYLIESIMNAAGIPVGVIGTINYRFGGTSIAAKTTTPDSLSLQKTLNAMRNAGIKTVAMEVSSHALVQRRAAGCQFDAAVWTNLTQDHLDFHHTMQSYFEAKKSLFTQYLPQSSKPDKTAIINLDDTYGSTLIHECPKLKILTYGTTPRADIHPLKSELTEKGIAFTTQTPSGTLSISSNLIGYYNQMNLLAAVATAEGLHIPHNATVKGLRHVTVPGRLEAVPNPLGVTILVDYAHTPDALKNALASIKSLTRGRILTVFGCGGDRDRGKRPLMGAIAERHSDLIFVTNDNPRSEEPRKIIDDIRQGITQVPCMTAKSLPQAKSGYLVEPNRKKAIFLAIQTAQKGDTILIAGKGHEAYQITGSKKRPFSDSLVAKEAIRARMVKKG